MSGSNGCIDLEARWEKSPLLKIGFGILQCIFGVDAVEECVE